MGLMVILATSAAVLALVAYLAPSPLRRQAPTAKEKWDLPEPGGDFRLYRRVKGLLDELEAERNEARLERDVARRAYESALAEQNRLASKLESAQDMLCVWMHPQIKIQPRRQKISINA